MSKIAWDAVGERLFQTGVDRGVFYSYNTSTKVYENGKPWNGLSAVTASPSGAEASPVWADNIKYLNLISNEEFAATIEAYTYPDEFAECDGSAEVATGVTIGQQARKMFGFTYRTRIGNDVDGDSHGYIIHLVYGCKASPSERSYATVNDSPEAMTMSWSISTTPVEVKGFRPTATLDIDSTKTTAAKLTALENILYGTDADGQTQGTEPRLPLPAEVITLMSAKG